MFIGHFGVAFGAKRMAPAVSLGVLFAAAELADLIWPTLTLLGLEHFEIRPGITRVTPLDFVSYPYSHSLATMSVWGIVAGGAYLALRRSRAVAAVTIAAVVVSHWILDVATHRPDMPLVPGGSTRLGLGLWNSMPATIAVESIVFAAGVALYVGATTPRSRAGTLGLWSLIAFVTIVYFANLFGPPPPSTTMVAWSAQAIWLLIAWAAWADAARSVHGEERPESRRVYQ
jgi:hypothetical protein